MRTFNTYRSNGAELEKREKEIGKTPKSWEGNAKALCADSKRNRRWLRDWTKAESGLCGPLDTESFSNRRDLTAQHMVNLFTLGRLGLFCRLASRDGAPHVPSPSASDAAESRDRRAHLRAVSAKQEAETGGLSKLRNLKLQHSKIQSQK